MEATESQASHYNSSRRIFIRNAVTALAGVTFTGTTVGIIRRYTYELSNISVVINNLPREFQGFTIALVSDIHSSIFMTKERMQDYAAVVNSVNADLITVTGDFVNSTIDEVYPFAEAFSSLKAQYGVYGVMGNHDYFTRDPEIVAREVNACGINLLRNNHVVIDKNGSKLFLLGLDDVGNVRRASSQMDQATAGIENTDPKILMCHRPYFFQQAADRNIGLTLSGHTHGGQIVFTKIGNNVIAPARMVSPYVAGLYSIGSSQMYVTRGIGTVGVPIRLNCPPEITKITLVKS